MRSASAKQAHVVPNSLRPGQMGPHALLPPVGEISACGRRVAASPTGGMAPLATPVGAQTSRPLYRRWMLLGNWDDDYAASSEVVCFAPLVTPGPLWHV